MTFRLGELFCGPGGLAHGALNARLTALDGQPFTTLSHAWASDYDKDSCATYRHNICPDKPETVICRDVRHLDPETLRRISPIDAFAFGFPCNDFSLVGKQKGMEGAFGPLYSYGIQMLHAFQPLFFVAENVGGLTSANDGKTFQILLDEMYKAGYNLTPHLYKFEEYGIPQARHRILIVGIRSDLYLAFKVPAPSALCKRTCRDAIEHPCIPQDAQNHERTQQSTQVVERLKHIRPGENAFTATIPQELRLNVKNVTMSQIYRRLDPDKPAYTITGSGGGGTHVYHWKEDRALTNRERARLQTFPDDFVFAGSKESVRKQIGMAVPPEAARIVFEAILKTFAGLEYPSRSCNILYKRQGYLTPLPVLQDREVQLEFSLKERKQGCLAGIK